MSISGASVVEVNDDIIVVLINILLTFFTLMFSRTSVSYKRKPISANTNMISKLAKMLKNHPNIVKRRGLDLASWLGRVCL